MPGTQYPRLKLQILALDVVDMGKGVECQTPFDSQSPTNKMAAMVFEGPLFPTLARVKLSQTRSVVELSSTLSSERWPDDVLM